MDVELLVDLFDVEGDRVDADEQAVADLPVGLAVDESSQHVTLAWREQLRRRIGRSEHADDLPSDRRGHRRTTVVRLSDGVEQCRRRRGFEEIARGPGAERREDALPVVVYGEHEQLRVRPLL